MKNKIVKKKKIVKKSVAKKVVGPKPIGVVTHFYNKIKVGIVKFRKPVKSGTEVFFRGAHTDFSQKLDSIQYDHKVIAVAPKGKEVGIKVKKRVHERDQVFEK